jgi:hypothetical protein
MLVQHMLKLDDFLAVAGGEGYRQCAGAEAGECAYSVAGEAYDGTKQQISKGGMQEQISKNDTSDKQFKMIKNNWISA